MGLLYTARFFRQLRKAPSSVQAALDEIVARHLEHPNPGLRTRELPAQIGDERIEIVRVYRSWFAYLTRDRSSGDIQLLVLLDSDRRPFPRSVDVKPKLGHLKRFKRSFRKAPADVQAAFYEQLSLLITNPDSPQLEMKQITRDLIAISVTPSWLLYFRRTDEEIITVHIKAKPK